MFLIIGAVVVIGSVLGGFMMVGGKLLALWHVTCTSVRSAASRS